MRISKDFLHKKKYNKYPIIYSNKFGIYRTRIKLNQRCHTFELGTKDKKTAISLAIKLRESYYLKKIKGYNPWHHELLDIKEGLKKWLYAVKNNYSTNYYKNFYSVTEGYLIPFINKYSYKYFHDINSITFKDELIEYAETIFIKKHQSSMSDRYHNTFIKTLSSIFKFGLNAGYYSQVVKLKQKSETKKIPRKHISPELFVEILRACENNHEQFILRLLYSTGMRKQELLNIKISHIHLDNNYILLPKTKNGHPRTINIIPDLKEELKKLTEEYFYKGHSKKGKYYPRSSIEDDPLNEYLFRHIGGEKIADIKSIWNRIKRRIALPEGICIHSLRHSFITLLLKNRVDKNIVQKLSGHRSSCIDEYDHTEAIHFQDVVVNNIKLPKIEPNSLS